VKKKTPNSPILQFYVWTASFGALVALVIVFSEPSETSRTWILGLSKLRAAMATVLLLWMLATGLSALKLRRSSEGMKRIRAWISNPWVYSGLLVFSSAVLMVSIQLWYLARIAIDPYVKGYLERLIPILFLGVFLSLQNLILLPLIRFGWLDLRGKVSDKLLRIIGLLFGLILLFWALIALTRIGLTPDQIGWDPPGVPVLAVQVWIAFLIGLTYLGLAHLIYASQLSRSRLLDIIVSIVLWGAAAFFWSQQPIAPNYFALTPQEPNFEFYPYSDAATHDVLAQRLLVGEGFPGVARKPLYVIFLALLRALAGQSYQNIGLLQIMILALIPVCIYWLTKSLHHRISGVIAAILIILREKNAIAVSGQIGVSHAKLLMSDLPAMLGIVLLTWVIVVWLNKPQTRRIFPLGIGGILGLLLLIRPQTVILLPAVVLLIVVLFFRRPSAGLPVLAMMVLGLALVLGPWLWRSYRLTGQFVLNDPIQNAFLTQQYSLTPGYGRVQRLPDETDGEYAQRIDEYLTDFITNNMGVVAGFITSHFAHNVIEMMVSLPMSPWVVQNSESDLFPFWSQQSDRLWEDCCSPRTYVAMNPFWDQWGGSLSGEMVFSLIINLALISIGLGVSHQRKDIVGWIPLGVSLVYILSTSVGRYSGWRLILPADWVFFVYFAIGLGQISFSVLAYFTRKSPPLTDLIRDENTWQRVAAVQTKNAALYPSGVILGIVLLGFGLSPILIERFVSPRYTDITKDDALSYFESLLDAEQIMPAVEKLLKDDRAVVFEGLGLYPRFYKAGRGEPGGDWPAFSPRDYPRLGFVVVGPQQHNVVIPLDESPSYFPNASDVIVLGCRADGHISARLVVLTDEDEYTLVHLPKDELSCSLALP